MAVEKPETKVVPLTFTSENAPTPGLRLQALMRETPSKAWFKIRDLADRFSGTLVKSERHGASIGSLAFHEAICQTLGWGFEGMTSTYITVGRPMAEGDCHPLTEVGWHFDRLVAVWPWPEDKFELAYINIQDADGNILRQGVGCIVRETSLQWVRPGTTIFALLTEYDPKSRQWSDCTNPF